MFKMRPQTTMKLHLIIIASMTAIGLYDLSVGNDIGAAISFTVAAFNAWRYYQLSKLFGVEKTWRSYR